MKPPLRLFALFENDTNPYDVAYRSVHDAKERNAHLVSLGHANATKPERLDLYPPQWPHIFRRPVWVLIDMSNGDPRYKRGKIYVWHFATKKAAVAHKKAQNSMRGKARLAGPYSYRGRVKGEVR